jgi:putative aminopeptidase FrvX
VIVQAKSGASGGEEVTNGGIAGAGFGLEGDLAVPIETTVKASSEAKHRQRPNRSTALIVGARKSRLEI